MKYHPSSPAGSIESLARRALRWLTSPRVTLLLGEPFFWLLGLRHGEREIGLSEVGRVLVLRLDEIGDVVMSTPFLRELRRNLPKAWITLVVKPAVYNLVEICPYVDEVLTYDWSVSRYLAPLQRHWRALALAYCHLWSRRFDLVILPRWDADHYHATFVAYFSGAPRRVGYSESVTEHKRRVNGGFNRLLTCVLDTNSLKHEVEHNLDMIRFLGGTVQEEREELWMSPEDEAFAEQVLTSHGVRTTDFLIGLSPAAGAPKRMWPLVNFIQLGIWLKTIHHARIVVVGGQGEETLGQELQRQLGDMVLNVVGQTTLRQTGALLKRCHLYVGNDAGPMHLAAAMGVPVIEISCHPQGGSLLHLNSPSRFGPWGVPHVVLQPGKALDPCFDACLAGQPHCILGITPEQVKQAVAGHLSQIGMHTPRTEACAAQL